MQSEIPFEPVATGFDTAAVNLVLNMQRLQIARADKYIIRLSIDEEEIVTLPLYILEDPRAKHANPGTDGEVRN